MEPTEAVTAVERVERFDVSPEVLWGAITNPELLAEWFGPVEFDLAPDGAITHADVGVIGAVEVVEAPRRIEFVWLAPGTDAPSSVEIVIDGDGNGGGGDLDGDADGEGGSILRVREVLVDPDWDRRPAWFASASSRSRRVPIGFHA